jgi:1,4-dihydroxy-2-naphthoate octaprenyltransferase
MQYRAWLIFLAQMWVIATAIVGIAIIWSITLGAFIMAFRLLRPFKKSDRPNRGA